MYDRVLWLAGMPRSGTTWLSQAFSAHPAARVKFCPLYSYEFKLRCGPQSTAAEWRALFHDVYRTPGEFLDQEHLRRNGLVPTFAERHADPALLVIKSNRFHDLAPAILERCPEVSWLAVVRHPAAAIHSWIENALEFPPGEDPRSEWRTGACRKTGPGEFWGFDDWLFVTELQTELAARYPERVRILRYDVAAEHPHEALADVFAWCGLEPHAAVQAFLTDSQSRHSDHRRSVYKTRGQEQRWRRELDPHIATEIERATRARGLGHFLEEAPRGGSAFWS